MFPWKQHKNMYVYKFHIVSKGSTPSKIYIPDK